MKIYLIWAMIGIVAYFLWLLWGELKKNRLKLIAEMHFRDEWYFLKTLSTVNNETFKRQLDDDGLPDSLKYWWVRLHYELNGSDDFMRDIKADHPFFPHVDYDELIEEAENRREEFWQRVKDYKKIKR